MCLRRRIHGLARADFWSPIPLTKETPMPMAGSLKRVLVCSLTLRSASYWHRRRILFYFCLEGQLRRARQVSTSCSLMLLLLNCIIHIIFHRTKHSSRCRFCLQTEWTFCNVICLLNPMSSQFNERRGCGILSWGDELRAENTAGCDG